MKSVQARGFFWSPFSRVLSEWEDLQRWNYTFITNTRKYKPEKSLYLDTFPARQSVITKITPKKILENFSDFHYVASKNKMH